jgi:hypothetical protein
VFIPTTLNSSTSCFSNKYFFTLFAAILLLTSSAFSQVNVTTFQDDNFRTGQNLNETILTPANVKSSTFGKLFSHKLDGYIYAQPLYLFNITLAGSAHNVVYAVSEHDTVYAFDADSASGTNANPLWQISFLKPGSISTISSNDVGCSDMVPEIGISGTPVIDTTTGTMYLVSVTKVSGKAVQQLHALDVTSGAEKFGGPVTISATVPGTGVANVSGQISFDPLHNRQRAALLLQNGSIEIGWSSYCDNNPYHGWIMSYNAATLAQEGAWSTTPNGTRGGVWQAGGGLAADDDSNIYFATGNGTFDGNKSGGTEFSESIVKLGLGSTGLSVLDYFTPYNQYSLTQGDADLGSGGVLLVPDLPMGSAYQHLLIEAGKEGSIYVIDRDGMGGYNAGNNNQIVQYLPYIVGGLWSTPAFWNNNVYFGGQSDRMRAFSLDPSTGFLSTSATSQTGTSYGYPGPTPTISANGATNGIVWSIQADGSGANGASILHAYDAANLATELYNNTQNKNRDSLNGAVKFTVPTIANGKVYVGTHYTLTTFGLLP